MIAESRSRQFKAVTSIGAASELKNL
jgi:hypothetical protein